EQAGPPAVDVAITGQRRADQHGVRGAGIQPAPGPKGNIQARQAAAALQRRRVLDGDDAIAAVHAATASPARSNAVAKSSMMSSICSMPTDTRISSLDTPAARRSSSPSCWWVVLAG